MLALCVLFHSMGVLLPSGTVSVLQRLLLCERLRMRLMPDTTYFSSISPNPKPATSSDAPGKKQGSCLHPKGKMNARLTEKQKSVSKEEWLPKGLSRTIFDNTQFSQYMLTTEPNLQMKTQLRLLWFKGSLLNLSPRDGINWNLLPHTFKVLRVD